MGGWYEQREKSLQRLNYANYAAYLASLRWRSIRQKVFRRCRGRCEVCGVASATQVHHRSYCLLAMVGRRLDFLVGCCRPCHERAEFDAGRKVGPRDANRRMAKAALSCGRVLYGLCHACRKNPTKPGQTKCGRCKRDGR